MPNASVRAEADEEVSFVDSYIDSLYLSEQFMNAVILPLTPYTDILCTYSVDLLWKDYATASRSQFIYVFREGLFEVDVHAALRVVSHG